MARLGNVKPTLFTKLRESIIAQSVGRIFLCAGTPQIKDTVVDLKVNGSVIKTTLDHPFYRGSDWVEVRNLNVGDTLVNNESDTLIVEEIHAYASNARVFNFTVDGLHTYLVSEDGLKVHNCGFKFKTR